MIVKATAHSEPRGLLCSTSYSAVGGRNLLADRYACAYDPALCALYARTAWWYWRQVMAALSGID